MKHNSNNNKKKKRNRERKSTALIDELRGLFSSLFVVECACRADYGISTQML